MTNGKHTSGSGLRQTFKPQRQLKVKRACHAYQLTQSVLQRTPIGEIHLKGHWLIQAGFEIESKVTVRVMEGCLVLTCEA